MDEDKDEEEEEEVGVEEGTAVCELIVLIVLKHPLPPSFTLSCIALPCLRLLISLSWQLIISSEFRNTLSCDGNT